MSVASTAKARRRRRPKSQPRRYLQRNVPRQWRHRLAPADPRHRGPGACRPCGRACAGLLFTWWLWAGAAIWATIDREWGNAAWLWPDGGRDAARRANRTPAALRPRAPDGGRHQGVRREYGGRHRRPVRGRQPRDRAEQRRRVLSGDARRDPARTAVGDDRGLHLLERRGGARVRARPRRACAARRGGEDPAGRRRLGDDRHRDPGDPRERRLPARVVPPDSLVHDRPLQPADAPQDAARGRARGIHRRRRHRRSVERSRAGSRALARRAGAGRGSGRRAAADRIRRRTGWRRPASW